ncbi:MAG: NAD-dependent epimerase/dehydratase family protein [archaeon]|nr:NAD-dependent epimerase/dehydratase family protein [Nanoarchaeota archaeon]
MEGNILVTGATGAIGRNLVPLLREKYGVNKVIVGYNSRIPQGSLADGPTVQVNVVNKNELYDIVTKQKVSCIYHLAALLSVAAEKDPKAAERVNTQGLRNVLDIMAEQVAKGNKMTGFWASSIAVYGEGLPTENVAEDVVLNPITVYGKEKIVGEQAIAEFCKTAGVDVRIIRFPGLNGPGKPGPGTTEYAIEMIQAAAKGNHYTAPLRQDTIMPMMDMRDAVRAIMQLMTAPTETIEVGKPYNIAAFSFSPEELAKVVKEFNPSFTVEYEPNELMQKIADSWPNTIDDSRARKQWGWKSTVSLKEMVRNIYEAAKGEH